ncbi:PilN domain-containing protein [Kozakia baliensis]|nr:PilN domain-containing protein [Kozakia baliensis]
MTELFPTVLKGKDRQDIRLAVHPDGNVSEAEIQQCQAVLAESRRRRAFPRRRPDISLMLPEGGILARDVSLPEAAADNAAQAIGYDLDRLTPFQAQDVVWTMNRKTEAGKQGNAVFRLLVAPRFLFETGLERLQRAGVAPTRLCMVGAAGRTEIIPFAAIARKKSRLVYVLPAILCGLTIVPFLAQEVQIFDLNRKANALADKRDIAENLRREIASFTAGPVAVEKEERRIGSPLETIRTLTETLPDGTFLTALRIHDHHITMEGQSKQATQLIGILEHHAAFTDAAFSGPVTRSEDKDQDVFTINAVAPN